MCITLMDVMSLGWSVLAIVGAASIFIGLMELRHRKD